MNTLVHKVPNSRTKACGVVHLGIWTMYLTVATMLSPLTFADHRYICVYETPLAEIPLYSLPSDDIKTTFERMTKLAAFYKKKDEHCIHTVMYIRMYSVIVILAVVMTTGWLVYNTFFNAPGTITKDELYQARNSLIFIFLNLVILVPPILSFWTRHPETMISSFGL